MAESNETPEESHKSYCSSDGNEPAAQGNNFTDESQVIRAGNDEETLHKEVTRRNLAALITILIFCTAVMAFKPSAPVIGTIGLLATGIYTTWRRGK